MKSKYFLDLLLQMKLGFLTSTPDESMIENFCFIISLLVLEGFPVAFFNNGLQAL